MGFWSADGVVHGHFDRAVVPPAVKEPPCIQTSTGSEPVGAPTGAHTFRKRHRSLMRAGPISCSLFSNGPWMQSSP